MATLENKLALSCPVDRQVRSPSLGTSSRETLAPGHRETWTKIVIVTTIRKSLYRGSLHDPMALSPGDRSLGKLRLRQGPGIAQW